MINRIINICSILFGVFLLITGLRIWLFNQSILPPIYLSWLDSISLGGNIFNQHLVLGYFLLGLVILKSALNISRLVRFRENDNKEHILWQIKRFVNLTIFLLVIALVVSGFAIYKSRFTTVVTLVTFKNIHIYSTWGIIVLFVLYVVIWALSRRQLKIESAIEAVAIRQNLVWVLLSVVVAVGASWLVFKYIESPASLISKNINRRIALNGKEGIEWTGTDSVTVIVTNGDNFPGGSTKVTIKSFHNRIDIYFLFRWRDWEPSFNRSLEKTVNGWRELKSEFSPFGESVYFEDELAVSFHKIKSGCAQSCHLGGESKTGLHYTQGDTADLWYWQAIGTNPAWEGDDGWWAGFIDDSMGGRHFDNSVAGGNISNLNEEWDEPYFLPGPLWFGNWIWLESSHYLPYRAGLDNYKLGSTLPARLVRNFVGDRGDLNARALWSNGFWTLEISRKLRTGSPFDISLRNDCWFSVAVFNNAEFKHAYHLRPIKLIIE